MFLSRYISTVSVQPWHLELMRFAPDHDVHDVRRGDDLLVGTDASLAVGLRRRRCRMHVPTRRGTVVGLPPNVPVLRRPVASDEAATLRSGC